MPPKRTVSDRTAALLEKQRELDERIKRSMQRDRSVIRKARNRALLLIGVAIEHHLRRQPSHLPTVLGIVSCLKGHEKETVVSFLGAISAEDSAPSQVPSSDAPQPPQPNEP